MGPLSFPNHALVYVDAQVIIYSIERHPIYASALQLAWDLASAGEIRLCTSEFTILECMVRPERENNRDLIQRYERVFASDHTLRWWPITREILLDAARLRASHSSLRSPDSLHAATAATCKAAVFLTNDNRLARVVGETARWISSD